MHRISLLNYSLHHIQPGVLWEGGGGVFIADIPHFRPRPPSLRLSPLCHQLSCHISELFQYFFFFWPKLLFSLCPKPFFLSSQQKRDETLSIRLHLLLLRKQNPLEMKHLVKCFKPHSNNSLPQRDFSSLSTLSLRGHAGTDASLRLCKIHSRNKFSQQDVSVPSVGERDHSTKPGVGSTRSRPICFCFKQSVSFSGTLKTEG